MGKERDNGLSACQIKIEGNLINGYKYLNLSLNKKVTKLVIIKDKGDTFKQIANTYEVENSLFDNTSNKEIIEITLCSAFNNIKCPVCNMEFSALRFTKSPLGNICHFCWKDYSPPIEWKALDIESYLKEDCKR